MPFPSHTYLPTYTYRSIGASTAPFISGLLFEQPHLRSYPFFIAGGLKIVYDLLLLGSFAAVKTPEEKDRHARQKQQQKETGPLLKSTV